MQRHRSIKGKRLRFYLHPDRSPTYYNISHYLLELGWSRTHIPCRAHFSEKHFQFDSSVAECLEYKHQLARLVSQYCPMVMPTTYCINDNNWIAILNELISLNDSQANPNSCSLTTGSSLIDPPAESPIWILKPALLNNGQHIQIFQHLSQLEGYYSSSARVGGDYVLQQYITPPYLLKGPHAGHKYSIRMFVVLTNYAGAYLYPEGYFNIGLHPYTEDNFTDLRPHLTNEHLSEDALNVVQVPTSQYDLFKPFYPQIKNIIKAVLDGLWQHYPHVGIHKKQRRLAIFGFDFLVDASARVWLLEANHAPCFPVSTGHPLRDTLYYDFWQAFISSFVIPIALNQEAEAVDYGPFLSLRT